MRNDVNKPPQKNVYMSEQIHGQNSFSVVQTITMTILTCFPALPRLLPRTDLSWRTWISLSLSTQWQILGNRTLMWKA